MKSVISRIGAFIIVAIFLTVLSLMVHTLSAAEPVNIELDSIDPYGDGWEEGYCEGWKDVKGQYAYCPYTPYCPYPEYDCSSGFRCGYNRGFKAGRKAARDN
jgi:hypothetical protein